MNYVAIVFAFLILCTSSALAQKKGYYLLELGHYNYLMSTAIYEINDANWKGPDMAYEQVGQYLAIGKGTSWFQRKLQLGLLLSYLNFKQTNAMNVLGELKLKPFDETGVPFLNIRLGYHHLWNQYPGGKGSAMADLGAGIEFNVNHNTRLYLKSGMAITHQTIFIPFAVGCQF